MIKNINPRIMADLALAMSMPVLGEGYGSYGMRAPWVNNARKQNRKRMEPGKKRNRKANKVKRASRRANR